MRVSSLKTAQRVERVNNSLFKIISYGLSNDYPQKCLEVLQSSGTGTHCVDTKAKFLSGESFVNIELEKLKFGTLKGGEFRRKLAFDMAVFQGFAVHVTYNGLLEKVELKYIPFEHCRLGANKTPNGSFVFNNKIAIHPDWGGRVKRPRPEEVEYIDVYSDDFEVIKEQITTAGGFEKWKGQIYWYSVDGLGQYPMASFDSVITDMNTEDGIATVKNRNAKNNFFPAGIIVTKGRNIPDGDSEAKKQYEEEYDDEKGSLRELQGDEKAFKLWHVRIENDEEIPKFIPIQTTDGDKLFTYSESSVQKNIGKVFGQPPILRYDLIPGKLGTSTEIKDAYNFYNTLTSLERQQIGDVLTEITGMDYSIKALEYAY